MGFFGRLRLNGARVDDIVIELHGTHCQEAFFAAIAGHGFEAGTCDELTVCRKERAITREVRAMNMHVTQQHVMLFTPAASSETRTSGLATGLHTTIFDPCPRKI
jgi:hypothetical protein